jgi:hypothetical protein
MKVFLRSSASGLFYVAPSHWVSHRDAAFDFQYPERATQLAREEKWAGIEMLLCYDVPRCDLIVPIADAG